MKTKKTKALLTHWLSIFFLLAFLSFLSLPASAGQKTVRGMVFEDANANGIYDIGETGVPVVSVSNQFDVVQTDDKGQFRLPIGKEAIIFITKPAAYDLPLDDNHFPRFYYIHQPAGSPAGLKYKGIPPTGKLPKMLYFPLLKGREVETFSVIVTGDPQTQTREEINYFRDDVVTHMLAVKADFYLALGDIVYNDLALFEPMNKLVRQLGIPIRHVQGNHDMDFDVPDFHRQAETFKRIHGPEYYSFDYGKVHFVVLDTVQYSGWNSKENKAGLYTGNIHERQFTWLKNDLSFVPGDRLVALAMHIPIESALYQDSYTMIANRGALFDLLKERPHLLALAGHMHYFEYREFAESSGWKGSARFPSIIAGAACGTWWHGPKDPDGIPFGICTDGTPNGFFRFTFSGNTYSYDFYPCGPVENKYMRIDSPKGTLSGQELKDRVIDVNVFTGTPETIVTYRLDDGPPLPMERTIKNDSFFSRLVAENKSCYKEWMEPSLNSHTWTAPLPENLAPGLHRVTIEVKDQQGNVFTGHRLFEIL